MRRAIIAIFAMSACTPHLERPESASPACSGPQCAYIVDARGKGGFAGVDGPAGMQGAVGGMGSLEPTVAGGNGGPGTDGGNGTPGSAGERGGDVLVRLTRVGSLLQIAARFGTDEARYTIDPAGGSLSIICDGGRGGDGGAGGRGGPGGPAGMGYPSGMPGATGRPGAGGDGGRGGDGGSVTIVATTEAAPFLSVIHVSNHGGDGGSGGSPGFGGMTGMNGFPGNNGATPTIRVEPDSVRQQ